MIFLITFPFCRYLCTWLLAEARVLKYCKRDILQVFLGSPEAASAGNLARELFLQTGEILRVPISSRWCLSHPNLPALKSHPSLGLATPFHPVTSGAL